jgi:soluble lytic murein transglycosylase
MNHTLMANLTRRGQQRTRRVSRLFLPAFLLLIMLSPSAYLGLHVWRQLHPSYAGFEDLINEAARRHGISACLVKSVIRQETGFRPWQVGKAGEIGLMQLTLPAVRDWETMTGGNCRHPGLLFDPRLNIEVGSWYLSRALRRWGDYRDAEVMALAEYNAGRARALEWAPESVGDPALGRVRFPGTKDYIRNVMRYCENYEQGARQSGP